MSTIITHPAREAHADRDAAARHRADRLAKATTDQLQAALAYLSMIDPEAFEIAFTAVAPRPPTTPKTKTPSRSAPPAAPRSASSPSSSSTGATTAATPSPGAPTRLTTPATPPRSPGTSPTRPRKSSSSYCSCAPPVSSAGHGRLWAARHDRHRPPPAASTCRPNAAILA